jgi:RNA polymerase sigma-70 factor (ECF subfamily)
MDDRRRPAGRGCEYDRSRSLPASPERTVAEFDRLRPYLLRVAYSHLGSLSEAEDLVQETWLRLARTDRAEIRDLRAWLTTVVSRLALDALTSARARRERYVGPWLPEPLVQDAGDSSDPAHRTDLDEDVSMAMLIVLESLSPAERSAFLLHDVFGYSFEEVARIVDRTPAATRKLAGRARDAVEARRPRYPARAQEQRQIVEAFLGATQDGDIASLLALLDPSVTYRSDGGGLVPAARTVFTGAERVARIFTAMARHYGALFTGSAIAVNGAPGLLLEIGHDLSVVAVTVDRGRITSLDIIRNPDKLTTLGRGAPAPRPPAEA